MQFFRETWMKRSSLELKGGKKRRRVDVACSFEWVFLLCNHFTPFPLIIAVTQYAHMYTWEIRKNGGSSCDWEENKRLSELTCSFSALVRRHSFWCFGQELWKRESFFFFASYGFLLTLWKSSEHSSIIIIYYLCVRRRKETRMRLIWWDEGCMHLNENQTDLFGD